MWTTKKVTNHSGSAEVPRDTAESDYVLLRASDVLACMVERMYQ